MKMPDPTFPPLLKGHAVDSDTDAFDTACARAGAGKLGAGDVVWSRNTYNLDIAIVLEPDVPPAVAAQMMPVCMVAIGDCIGALTPPQVGQTFTWPNLIRINGATAGRVVAAMPAGGAGGEAAAEEQTEFDVILTGFG
ncbi:MAG: biotin/lipoate--protein ligase family protein, partial [Pseudomonadota bacterium]|nr:biotin/lipoate--protein ligase family protein [Pseudomonadota bacterium]